MSGVRPGLPERGSDADLFKEVNRRLDALETAARLPLSSIGSGGLTIENGGRLVFLDPSGEILLVIDEDGLAVYEPDDTPLTILDGTRLRFNRSNGFRQIEITPAGGLKIYDTDGTTEKVVLDEDGLAIDGILQPALANLTEADSDNPSLSTSLSTLTQITFAIPSWADEVTLMTFARLQASNLTGALRNFTNELTNDVGGLDDATDDNNSIPTNETKSSFVALTTTVSSPGASIVCRQRGSVSAVGGGGWTAEARIEGIAIVRRTS